jgi:putative SOS response-associated peptidase YedK
MQPAAGAQHAGMCGRYVVDTATGKSVPKYPAEPVRRLRFAAEHDLAGFDIRPTSHAAIVLPGRQLGVARWGWARDFANAGRIINARWETAAVKPTFAAAVGRRRCVIPATAYYECRRDERDRPLEKYAFLPAASDTIFAMAGLYEDVVGPAGSERRFLVLTRPMLRHAGIHDRTPVMLSPDAEAAWLDPQSSSDDVMAAARSLGDDDLVPRRVAHGPTRARPAGPWLLEPVADGPTESRITWG